MFYWGNHCAISSWNALRTEAQQVQQRHYFLLHQLMQLKEKQTRSLFPTGSSLWMWNLLFPINRLPEVRGPGSGWVGKNNWKLNKMHTRWLWRCGIAPFQSQIHLLFPCDDVTFTRFYLPHVPGRKLPDAKWATNFLWVICEGANRLKKKKIIATPKRKAVDLCYQHLLTGAKRWSWIIQPGDVVFLLIKVIALNRF